MNRIDNIVETDGALILASRDGTLQSILAADIFFSGMGWADAPGD